MAALISTSRLGAHMLQANPSGFKIPGTVAASEALGANSLVGIRTDNGKMEQLVDEPAYGYKGVVVACEEFPAQAADATAEFETRTGVVLLCDYEEADADDGDLYANVYAADYKTVAADDGIGNTRPLVGKIVEVVSATQVRVLVDLRLQ